MSLLKHNWFIKLFGPEEGTGGGTTTTEVPSGDMDTDDVIKFLGEDDDKVETIDLNKVDKVKATEKSDDENDDKDDDKNDEVDELKELEEELEEPTEEQLELMTPVRRREILKKYPNLFKEFPYLERAYYREQQFTELLPTIEDARIAVESAQILHNFETDVVAGNTEKLLQAVKEKSPKGFAALVDNYLPTLARVDEKAYHHVLGNITKHTIMAMVGEAKRSNNEVLQSAAQILNQFVFGTSEWNAPSRLSREDSAPDPEKNALVEREREHHRAAFESTVSDLNGRVNNILKSTIEGNIDPKSSMSDYVRKNASREALENLESLFSKDTRFRAITDKLWERAAQENYSKPSVDRIKSAFISKAKTLLPTVIKQARNEALKGLGRGVKEDDSETRTSSNSKSPSVGKPRSESGGKIKSAKDIPRGMSTLDFLNS
jgi:hypothetical protein